jgi:molybdate transport system substrate-binding protein
VRPSEGWLGTTRGAAAHVRAGTGRATRRVVAALVAGWVAGVSACAAAGPDGGDLVVSAAASLGDVVPALVEAYRSADPSTAIATNLAASGTLVQQIRQGAGVDVFLSASDREMELLRREGLVLEETIVAVAGNELVLVVPAGSDAAVTGLSDLAGPRVSRVALGAPASVPAGEYARQALERLGVWGGVEPRVVYATNVRQALAYVQAGEVDAALVYRTDAVSAAGVRVVAAVPPGSHAPVRYTAAVVAASERAASARRFVQFLAEPGGRAVFRAHGFPPPPPTEEE